MFRRSLLSFQLSLVAAFEPFELYRWKDTGVYEIVAASKKNKMNLLDNTYFSSLLQVTHYLSNNLNETARVAILTSKDGYPFSAGLDLSMMKSNVTKKTSPSSCAMPAMSCQEQHKTIRFFQDGVSSLARCRVPILCAIDGHCIGGATSIITACDIRYSTEKASFSVREAQVGMAADIGVLQRLPNIVGEGRARELAYTARFFNAQEAKEMGLLEDIFSTREEMMEAVRKVAQTIAQNSPLAVQGTKAIMNRRTEPLSEQLLEYTAAWNAANIACDDVVEAAVAFAERRHPEFKNFVVHSSSLCPPTTK